MPKDYPPKPVRWGAGRVAVIALRETLKAEIEAGHPLTMIHERHQTELGGVQYVHFTRLVRRYVTAALPSRQAKGKPQPTQESTSGRERDNPDRTAFDFDPQPPPGQWKRPRGT